MGCTSILHAGRVLPEIEAFGPVYIAMKFLKAPDRTI
jgi:hypothetical protein